MTLGNLTILLKITCIPNLIQKRLHLKYTKNKLKSRKKLYPNHHLHPNRLRINKFNKNHIKNQLRIIISRRSFLLL